MMRFLKSGGELWGLQDYWTRIGELTGRSVSVTNFSWGPERISVSIIIFGH